MLHHFTEPKAEGKSSSCMSYGRDTHFNPHLSDDILH